jgi:hypothetical protein
LTQRYSARPAEFVRNEPAEPVPVVITFPVVDALPDAAAAAAELDPDPLLPHAATTRAAASGTPSLTGMGIRVSNDLLIFIVSFSGGKGLCQPPRIGYLPT